MKIPVIRQPQQIPSSTSWGAEAVKGALTSHEHGDFTLSAPLIDACRRDDRIFGCLSALTRAVCRLPFSIGEGLPGDRKAIEVRDLLAAVWPRMFPRSALSALVRQHVMAGTGLAQLRWTAAGDRGARAWLPIVEPWHLGGLNYDETFDLWRVATRTELVEQPRLVPDDEVPAFLVTEPDGTASWMSGAIRALAFLFLYRAWNYRDWARFCERHGLPIIVINEPPFLDAESKRAFYNKVQRMGSESVFRLPQSANGESIGVNMLEPSSTSYSVFKEWCAQLDASISIVLTGTNLVTEVKSGSFAAADVHDGVRLDVLEGIAAGMADELRQKVIIPWGRLNVPGFTDEMAPVLSWKTDARWDPSVVATLAGSGIIDRNEARALLGFAPVDTMKNRVEDAALAALSRGGRFRDLVALVGAPAMERALPKRPPYTPADARKLRRIS